MLASNVEHSSYGPVRPVLFFVVVVAVDFASGGKEFDLPFADGDAFRRGSVAATAVIGDKAAGAAPADLDAAARAVCLLMSKTSMSSVRAMSRHEAPNVVARTSVDVAKATYRGVLISVTEGVAKRRAERASAGPIAAEARAR